MKDKIIINSLADYRITMDAIRNHLSFYFDDDWDKFFEDLKRYDIQLYVRSMFERIRPESQFNTLVVERSIAIDNALSLLRSMIKHEIDFRLIDSFGVREELGKLSDISPPLYDKIIKKLVEF